MYDTDAATEQQFRRRLMGLSPAERLLMAGSMFATTRTLVEAGIRRNHGAISSLELRRETLKRTYHPDFSPSELARIADRLI